MTKHNHAANPNPQMTKSVYRSLAEIPSKSEMTDREKERLALVKFGKKMVFDRKMSLDLIQQHI